jgi:hypothetical protein
MGLDYMQPNEFEQKGKMKPSPQLRAKGNNNFFLGLLNISLCEKKYPLDIIFRRFYN